jgi:hypothetical protein
MAGISLGTPVPVLSPSPRSPQPALQLVPAATRRRRNHGAFLLGGHLACVYSTRSVSRCYGISFEIGAGTLTLASAMTPAQARGLARALGAAADAVDLQVKDAGPADGRTVADPHAFRRHMARFELKKARRLLAEGNPDRAAAALARAKLWRRGADAAERVSGGVQ